MRNFSSKDYNNDGSSGKSLNYRGDFNNFDLFILSFNFNLSTINQHTMRILIFLASLLFIISLPACNKDDDNNPSGARLLDHYTTTAYPDTYHFDYNGSDQIIKTEYEEARTNIDISGNQLHFTEYRKLESREVSNATYTLNAQGNIISGHGSYSYNQSSPYTADITYVY